MTPQQPRQVRARDYARPYRGLALAVILRAIDDHHYSWLLGNSAAFRFWTDAADVDRQALAARVTALMWEWLWDLAARRIRAAMQERAS